MARGWNHRMRFSQSSTPHDVKWEIYRWMNLHKNLYPGGIRTREFLFWRWTRWPLCYATRTQSYDFDLQRQRWHQEPNPASAVNFYNITGSLARIENKNILFYFDKRSCLLQRWRCSYKFKSRRIGSRVSNKLLMFNFTRQVRKSFSNHALCRNTHLEKQGYKKRKKDSMIQRIKSVDLLSQVQIYLPTQGLYN
jgi:hypothetical protein